jgi:hypothetical protein
MDPTQNDEIEVPVGSSGYVLRDGDGVPVLGNEQFLSSQSLGYLSIETPGWTVSGFFGIDHIRLP